ncbi:S-methyl-5-thioribose-1-phosphate isomerase [candidate division KSB1 bacterium]
MEQAPRKALFWENNSITFIDQTALPLKLEYVTTDDYREIVAAIKTLRIRGAPLIGIAAAYAAVLGALKGIRLESAQFHARMKTVLEDIESSRPTAKNLFFAVDAMRSVLDFNREEESHTLKERLLEQAVRIHREDESLCERIGRFGAELIHDGDGIITHCNTGMLVTGGIGTALGVIITAHKSGKKIHVYADETRPLLQGARLTTWECRMNSVPVTLICDGAAAAVIKKKKVQCAITGADRIAPNGDTANKIGTYSLAVQCKEHNIPFYVAAPYSTFDFSIESGDDITIEERSSREVTHPAGQQTAPDNIDVYNPAFDVTPASLISAVITDAGVFYPPYGSWKDLKRS